MRLYGGSIMYRYGVPISIDSISDEHTQEELERYLSDFKRGGIERVFIAVLPGAYTRVFDRDITSPKFKRALDFFKENGLETGVWIGGFGHGGALAHEAGYELRADYTKMTGALGDAHDFGYCPTDERFTSDYVSNVKRIAELSPDLIMIDDDLRLNGRPYRLGCFCEYHLREFYRLTGENVPRENIERLILSGGKNKYRDAYMRMSRETIVEFLKRVRAAIDEVDPHIRAGFCISPFGWDIEGGDIAEKAKLLAGGTKPFVRPFGAPYHDQYDIIEALEGVRAELMWLKDAGLELFGEGDVYPRPRYNVSASSLELFDLVLMCDARSDGILKYMYDYDHRVGYETGYIERHIAHRELFSNVKRMFDGKRCVGVFNYSAMHKLESWELDEFHGEYMIGDLGALRLNTAAPLLAKNGIATAYEKGEYPTVVMGENARHIPLELLRGGAVLDSAAAEILKTRGVDTGIISRIKAELVFGEYFKNDDEFITGFDERGLYELECDERAEVISVIRPSESAGAYRYENEAGERFFVLASDIAFAPMNANYANSYCRQKELFEAIEWLCGRKLPATLKKSPRAYVLASKSENAMSVLVVNSFADDIVKPEIELDEEYTSVRAVGCTASITRDRVTLDRIEPFGFAAFEVSR